MTASDEQSVSRATAHYPPADISPAEFEQFVVEVLDAASPNVDRLTVTLHERITGLDGTYDFDATVRFELGGIAFLVPIEAKRHKNAIKRELVQVLHQKVQSVGAHKAVMISTAPYQSGALDYAKAYGIALATVTEGRFTFETKALGGSQAPSRQEARQRFGLPAFVAHVYGQGKEPGSTSITPLSPECPEHVVEEVLGVAVTG